MTRIQTEKRIFQILQYINHPIIPTLRESINLFSLKDLSLILKFLETWDLNPIHQFLTQKIQEYRAILEQIKMKKAFSKLKDHKINEEKERQKEQEEAEDMIRFD